MERRLFAVRAATQIDRDNRDEIIDAVCDMYDRVCEMNGIGVSDMVSIMFTMTSDLRTTNPATALRSRDERFAVPLFCMQEPDVDNMLARTIRLIIHYYAPGHHAPKAVYLHGATKLRPDLSR
ncbi:MAG: chorismate mutase [Sphaerochaetaceae bacterium]